VGRQVTGAEHREAERALQVDGHRFVGKLFAIAWMLAAGL
jgi:hypothetical protein